MDEIESLIIWMKSLYTTEAWKQEALDRIAMIGKPMVPALIGLLKETESLRDPYLQRYRYDKKHDYVSARKIALEGLMRIGIPAVLELCKICQDSKGVSRSVAIKAIASIAKQKPLCSELSDAATMLKEMIGRNMVYREAFHKRELISSVLINECIDALGDIGDPHSFCELAKYLMDSSLNSHAIFALEKTVAKCSNIGQLSGFDIELDRLLKSLTDEKAGSSESAKVRICLAELRCVIAKRKNELASNRDLLLDDVPKPPKKGGMFRTLNSKPETGNGQRISKEGG